MSSEEIPECLSNRIDALNALVQDVLACMNKASNSSTGQPKSPKSDESSYKEPVTDPVKEKKGCNENTCPVRGASAEGSYCNNDPNTMCESCRITKERQEKDEGHFKPPQEIRSKTCLKTCTGLSCTCKDQKLKSSSTIDSSSTEDRFKYTSAPITRKPKRHDCGVVPKPSVPLRKALFNLKDAASFGKSCMDRVNELRSAQQTLIDQIQNLEEREKKGLVLLKKADCMWCSMEEQYKKQVDEKKETYKMLLKEKNEIDTEINKWRKTLKDLEFKIKNLDNASQEITVKTIQKANDIKVLEMEIESFKKRIASNTSDLEAAQNAYVSKKKASEAKLEKIADEMQKFQKKVGEECQSKENKEHEGTGYVKEARDDLQKICTSLLQKKLENEDLRAEKEAIIQEINLLKTTCENYSERCAKREEKIVEETKRIEKEISDHQIKCTQCHKSTDIADFIGYCSDCPRCVIRRDCIIKGEECFSDHTKDCVCTRVKKKFLDNVFENMYNVLEKQSKTCTGKEVADCIFTCLERSRNGKLDKDTRKILQDYILSTVKKNLNVTIVGGAVKTRCEMDKEMYGQLMLCLNDVTVTNLVKVNKADKATVPRKPPCTRWKETSECNCPQGPKYCPCVKQVPKPPTEPGSCGPSEGEEFLITTLPDMGLWKRQPCEEASCLGTNMRAAQCVLGPEALSKVRTHPKRPTLPIVPSGTFTHKKATRISGKKAVKSCHTDDRSRERSLHEMIEGCMGRYTKVSSKVHVADHLCEMCAARETYPGCDCARLPTQNKKNG